MAWRIPFARQCTPFRLCSLLALVLTVDLVQSETPGAIHEGGELGYALSVAYGSVMDNPDLLTVCVVGDGESETG